MKRIRVQIIFLSISFNLFSQGVIMGNVYYQNTGWTPAEGILVNANGSNGDYSKTNGEFLLKFPNSGIGKTVYPSIGEKNIAIDVNGNKVELVNEKELEYVSIPENPNKAPLKIIVCPKGARDIAARKYYGIIKNDIEHELSLKRKEIKELKRKLGLTNDLVLEKEKKLRVYEAFNDSIKIYKEAFKIASINRDASKKRVRNYLDALDAGVSVKEARKELSTEKAYNEALKSIESIESSIKEIQIKAENYSIQLEFNKAFAQYDTITKILKKRLTNPFLLLQNYFLKANLATEIKDYHKALKDYELALQILDNYNVNGLRKIIVLNKIGDAYLRMGNKKKALSILLAALNISNTLTLKKSDAFLIEQGEIHMNIGVVYMNLNEYSKAEEHFYDALEVLVPLVEGHLNTVGSNVSFLFTRVAFFYKNKGLQEKAEHYLKLAVQISDELNNIYPNEFTLLVIDNNLQLAQFYFSTQKLDEFYNLYSDILSTLRPLLKIDSYKYNKPYAELLNCSVIIKMSDVLFGHTFSVEEQNAIIETVALVENLLKIYPDSDKRIEEILDKMQATRYFFSDDKVKPNELLDTNSFFVDIILLEKENQIIRKSIKKEKHKKEKLKRYQLIVNRSLSTYEKYPANQVVKDYLRVSYAELAMYAVEFLSFDLAIKSAKKVNELDDTGDSFGFMNLVLVNAYVLQNRLDEAWVIYKKYKNKPFPGGIGFYKESFLADIQYLESKGIHHKEFGKIKRFLEE